MANDGLDIPEFLKLTRDQRRAAWRVFKPRPGQGSPSTERWRQYERQRQDEAKQKARERIEQLRAAKGQESFYD